VILLAARAQAACSPWPNCISDTAIKRGARIELALVHDGIFHSRRRGPLARSLAAASHHHIVDPSDLGRIARLLNPPRRRLVLSAAAPAVSRT